MRWFRPGINSLMGGIIIWGSLPDVKFEQKYALTKIYLTSEDPGFYEIKDLGEYVPPSEGFRSARYYDAVLVVRFVCNFNQGLPVYYYNKEIRLSAGDGKADISSVTEKIITDKKGFARVSFRSKGSARGEQVVFLVEGDKYKVELGNGPYYLNLKKCSFK